MTVVRVDVANPANQINAIEQYNVQSGASDAAFDQARVAANATGSSLETGVRYAQLAIPKDASNAGAKGRLGPRRERSSTSWEGAIERLPSLWDGQEEEDGENAGPPG